MKSILRPRLAAALLLAPMGAALVAQAAAAEERNIQPQVPMVQHTIIERFVMRPAGPMDAARELRFRLTGAPGGHAWLDIPGVLRGAPMVETRPGVYELAYVLRARDKPDAFARAVATLQRGGQRATALVEAAGDRGPGWGHRLGRDDRAPQITDVTPTHGDRVSARGWTRISARVSDEGTGVDPRSVILRIDGRDVTARTRIEDGHVRYAEDLAPGRHVAELVVRDRAGNTSRKSWSFEVVERDRGYGYGPGWGYGPGYGSGQAPGYGNGAPRW
jgi:hypothetical protein